MVFMFCNPLKAGRGEETREKLLQAGAVLFGQRGFEGVSARELAAAAGTPVSAVTYHYSTMETLYIAVIQQMVAQMDERLAPEIRAIQGALLAQTISPQAAIDRITEHLIQEIVCCQDHPEWPMLIVREHLLPGPAYDLVYEHAMMRPHALLCQLFALVQGAKPTDEAIELAAFAHIGKIIFFRIGVHTIKRRLEWSGLGQAQFPSIAQALAFKP